MSPTNKLMKTALHAEHLLLNARMGEFAHYDMPLQYTGVKAEVESVRNKCGMFDVSHMAEFFITGPEAITFVDQLITNSLKDKAIGKAVYTLLCNEDAKILDDLIVYLLAPEEVMICANASNHQKVLNWLKLHKTPFNCELVDRSASTSLIAIQGPETEHILSQLFELNLSDKDYYSAEKQNVWGEECIFARTGYTGEDGFEIFCSEQFALKLWRELLKKNVTPCGLVARDVLRIEAAYPLYGHEIDESLDPIAAGLKWAVKLSKENFIGKKALLPLEKNSARSFKFTMSQGIPRQGAVIYRQEGAQYHKVGAVTSGTFSPTLNKSLGMLALDQTFENNNATQLFVNIRDKYLPIDIVQQAFYKGSIKNVRNKK
jgi:aminomethyltransferase